MTFQEKLYENMKDLNEEVNYLNEMFLLFIRVENYQFNKLMLSRSFSLSSMRIVMIDVVKIISYIHKILS